METILPCTVPMDCRTEASLMCPGLLVLGRTFCICKFLQTKDSQLYLGHDTWGSMGAYVIEMSDELKKLFKAFSTASQLHGLLYSIGKSLAIP